jgi:hypothetical protein
MDYNKYLQVFQNAAKQIDKEVFQQAQLELVVEVVLNAVCLKLYKKTWANPTEDPVRSPSRIFFSVWLNEAALQEGKLLYNIHALKLRQLKGYTLQSRQFADTFRSAFKPYQHKWENVSVKFGPATLFEGWLSIDANHFEPEIVALAHQFLALAPVIDTCLAQYKK